MSSEICRHFVWRKNLCNWRWVSNNRKNEQCQSLDSWPTPFLFSTFQHRNASKKLHPNIQVKGIWNWSRNHFKARSISRHTVCGSPNGMCEIGEWKRKKNKHRNEQQNLKMLVFVCAFWRNSQMENIRKWVTVENVAQNCFFFFFYFIPVYFASIR